MAGKISVEIIFQDCYAVVPRVILLQTFRRSLLLAFSVVTRSRICHNTVQIPGVITEDASSEDWRNVQKRIGPH